MVIKPPPNLFNVHRCFRHSSVQILQKCVTVESPVAFARPTPNIALHSCVVLTLLKPILNIL